MSVFYKTIFDGAIVASDVIVIANGQTIEPLACEAEGCNKRANHAFASDNRTGQHHPDYVLLCTDHAIEFSQTNFHLPQEVTP